MKTKNLILSTFLVLSMLLGLVLPALAQQAKPLPPVPPVIKELKMLPGSDQFSIMNLTFSNNGKFLAAFFNADKIIRIYDIATGQILSELPSDILYKDKYVDGMAFTGENDSKLIVMRAEAPLKIIDWNNKTVETELDLGVNGFKITDFAFTPDQKYLAVAKQDGIDIWNFSTKTKDKSLLPNNKINAIDISSDGKFLVYAKSGNPAESIGTVDLTTMQMGKTPLANLDTVKKEQLPAYEVQMIDFTNGMNTLAGYLTMPVGTFKPDGPAGVYLINLQKDSYAGPASLSDFRLSMARYLAPFRGILTNSFNFKDDGKVSSSMDFINPENMQIMKSYPNSEFKAPMLSVNVSKDGKIMAAALKDQDGVKLYLYSLEMPKN